ncbi:MAG: RNA-binding domain-containing protein [Thermoleophilaceae bacterium]
MAVPVQPIVNEGHLRLLMDEQHESEILDYKRQLDLTGQSKRRTLVELAKDVAAMGSGAGGYIGVGLDGRGQPTGELTERDTQALDEASLRSQLGRYIPDGLDLRTAVHEIDGERLGVIYVGPHPDGLVVFKADGTYEDERRPITVFRAGEVFVRQGTQSRRWTQEEVRRWMRETRRRLEQEAAAQAAATLRPVVEQAQRTRAAADAPAEALDWNLDRGTLVAAVTEQMRRGDEIPLRLLVEGAGARAGALLRTDQALQADDLVAAQEGAEAGIGELLDRLVAIAARGIVIGKREMVEPALDAVLGAYNTAFDAHGIPQGNLLLQPPRLWLMVIERLYALGGFAVRKREWVTVRRLATDAPDDSRGFYRSVLRHGHVMAARADLLRDPDQPRTGVSLMLLANAHVARLPELHPDLPADDERILTSICQFDLLANLAVVHATQDLHSVYPNFRRFYSHRSDPAVVLLLEDTEARSILFPEDDETLAHVLRQLASIGSEEFFFTSGWMGYEDPRVEQFLAAHPPDDQSAVA